MRRSRSRPSHYRNLALKIHANHGKGIIPTPITMDELEDMLMEHGIMKAVDESHDRQDRRRTPGDRLTRQRMSVGLPHAGGRRYVVSGA